MMKALKSIHPGALLMALFFVALPISLSAQQNPDIVHGNLVQFNDNGAWCWYQDERAVVDTMQHKLIFGSVATGEGLGGSSRDGHVEGTVFDLGQRQGDRKLFRDTYSDDHNVPAFWVRPDGKYLTMYCDHYDDRSRYRIYDGSQWGEERHFGWPGVSNDKTYSNLYYLSAEDRLYNFSRADRKNPHMMVSSDYGDSWSYHGLLSQPDQSIGYVNGYFKYWSNGVDRIDFIATEYHPRDYNTSMYHGYIKGGKTYNSFGEVMDENITDKQAPKPADFTPVFKAGTEVNGETMNKVWNNDLVRYEDGTIAGLIKTRINGLHSNDPDHAFFYVRFNGDAWSYTYLGKAGKKLYGSEQDYTGLGALDPDDPTTIYISTPFDPRDQDEHLGVHEIFKGVTPDGGETWQWSAVTENSTRDNLRPIIPEWNSENTALMWFRGTYYSAGSIDAAVVGLLEDRDEERSPMTYVDASLDNTTNAVGGNVYLTGPSDQAGGSDQRWHERTGVGNGGSVLASSEVRGEDARMLRTAFTVEEDGQHDVWVNFWADPAVDWRIKAGLAKKHMQVYRHMASKQVEEGSHLSSVVRRSDNAVLYQAYLGRVDATSGETFYIYVDDYAIQTGTAEEQSGDEERTWYDGLSYAAVNETAVVVDEHPPMPDQFKLGQNYPNPFNPTTTITYEIPSTGSVELAVFSLSGRKVATLVDGNKSAGIHTISFDGAGLSSGVYFYRLSAQNYTTVKKMTLVK